MLPNNWEIGVIVGIIIWSIGTLLALGKIHGDSQARLKSIERLLGYGGDDTGVFVRKETLKAFRESDERIRGILDERIRDMEIRFRTRVDTLEQRINESG
jgi:hypothetical protein